jgi:long-chain acyl-CoA synthetase
MEKIWVKHYSKGIPAEVDVKRYASILEVFEGAVKKFHNRPAYTNMGVTLTYGDVDRLSRSFAAYLQKVAGLKKGDRIAIQMPNLLQYPVALFGALRAGLVVVNTNPLYTPREMEHQFKDSGAKAVVILANFAHNLQEVLPRTPIKHVVVTELGDMLGFPKRLLVNAVVKHVKKMVPEFRIPGAVPFNEALRLGTAQRLDPVSVTSDEIAVLQYTGGTTGVSKGAMLTHANLIANMQQASPVVMSVLKDAEEVVITALPLYHIFCFTVNCMIFMNHGGHSVLITNPKDIPAFVKELSKHKFTVMTGVNTLFNALMNHPDFAKLDFSHLKTTVGGGMAVQKVVAERWQKITGKPLVEGYGLTESSPVICVNPLDGRERIGSIGLPVPSTEVMIADEDGKELPLGETGEICARGPQVMKGYWQRPEETAKVITPDGWLKTGDIGFIDPDGYVKIVDRKKDMILVSGFNVYPNEVEDVIATHPGVLEVAAIGVPDDKAGEAVKVFVVKRDESLTSDQVREYAKTKLTGYKVPKHVEFRKELPKTNVGKILRRALRDDKPTA